MKQTLFITALAVLLTVPCIAQTQKKAVAKSTTPKKELALWPADKIKWESFGEEFPGVMFARLYGDMSKGGYAILVKVPPHFKIPLHYHTNDEWGVVISGTAIIALEDGKEKQYGPGSWLSVPKGVKHTTAAGSDGCVFLEESDEMEGTVMVGEEMMKK